MFDSLRLFFTHAIPFKEALNKLGDRSPVGSVLRSAEWRRVPVALRERAFFSATVENVRWLQQRQKFLRDFLAANTATNERGEKYFIAGGRAQFIEQAQKDAIRSGMGPLETGEVPGSLKDISSETRLGLIFDTQVQAAQGYGYWKQGQDPDILDAFPCQKFIRVIDVRAPREYHQAALGTVRRKDDLAFWIGLNRDFGVPWPPYGYNSGCDVEDVDRTEAESLGLLRSNETVRPVEKDFNEHLQASTRGLDQKLINLLTLAFQDQVEFSSDAVQWSNSALLRERESDVSREDGAAL